MQESQLLNHDLLLNLTPKGVRLYIIPTSARSGSKHFKKLYIPNDYVDGAELKRCAAPFPPSWSTVEAFAPSLKALLNFKYLTGMTTQEAVDLKKIITCVTDKHFVFCCSWGFYSPTRKFLHPLTPDKYLRRPLG